MEITTLKKIKKYILAIAMCLCLMFTSLTGCALIVPNNSKALEEKAISVGETVLSKKDVINLWYSFYNQNVNAFYYYSEDQIIQIFYKNIVLKHAVMQQTQELINSNKLKYSAGDDAQVWLDVLESISASVDTIEKALYTQQGTEEDNLPSHLQTQSTSSSNSDVKSYLYEEYEFKGMEDYECKYTPSNNIGAELGNTKVGADVETSTVKDIQSLLSTFLYKDQVESEDELELESLQDLKNKLNSSTYFTDIVKKDNRSKAFDMYVGKLMLSAKAEGSRLTADEALQKQIKELYISYYETYLQNMYSSYINSLVDVNEEGNQYYTLNDSAIVSRYLQLLGSDIQKYKLEENYIAVVEAEADNALLLYRFNGEYYYFTVQHLLVSFDETIKAELKNMYGNQTNASDEQYEIYQNIRDHFYTQIGKSGWEEYNNATYRDENGYDVYSMTINEDTVFVYFDKDWTMPEYDEETEDNQKQNGYYYLNGTDKVYITVEQYNECKQATVEVSTVLNQFNTTYTTTINYLQSYAESKETNWKPSEGELDDVHSALELNSAVSYVISKDLISLYLIGYKTGNTQTVEQMNHKVYTNLFMQHAFKYSADSASLGTELSDYVGMIIAGQDDNHTVGGGTYVNEFTDKARELAKEYLENVESGASYSQALDKDCFAISDYGIHMIIVNDVYKVSESAPITGNEILAEEIYGPADAPFDADKVADNVQKAVDKMKSIYVSSSSSQTLYQYMYELVRDELVGDSGTIYTKERNRLYKEYTEASSGSAKADLSGKMTYDELMEAIS